MNLKPANRSETLCHALLTLFLCIGTSIGLPAQAEVRSVYIQSRLDPNAITITEVDVVFVYNAQRLDSFPQSKSVWYANRRDLIQQWDSDIDVVSVFIPQGFDSESVSLPDRRGEAVSVFIFGQHDSASAAPVDVTDAERVTVYIDPFGIIVNAD